MASILVPIDFSPTSLNAALYAANFAKVLENSSVTLLSIIPDHLVGSDGTPVHDDPERRKDNITLHLENLQVSLYEMAGVRTEIDLQEGEFGVIIQHYILENSFDLVVMGVTGSAALEQVFGTNHAIEMISRSSTPVLVVPPNAVFKNIENVALAVELHDLEDILPLPDLFKWLGKLRAKVHIAHVNKHNQTELTESEATELVRLEEMLILNEPQSHLISGDSFADALNHMAVDENIDILFTFPHKHKFFDLLFRTTYTKQLVFHSTIPIIALPHE